MKRFFLLFLPIVLLVSSCKKEGDTAFEQSPDERINEALAKYQSALTGSPAGWNATIRTANGGIYHFYFRFNETNRVFMYADINFETASVLRESSYRLKALQTPTLIFDTYSYLHILSDPDARVNGGTFGLGLSSDFEFSLDSLAADSIQLTGRVNNTKVTLVKATQQDLDAWQNGEWAKVLAFENINKIPTYFKRINIGGTNYEIRADLVNRTITFTWVDGSGNLQQFTTGYNYDASGIVFLTPFNAGSQTINGLEITGWDAANLQIGVKVNGATTTIAGAAQPLKVDLNAPRRWWNYAISNGNTYWITAKGFHVNGVDDGFGVQSLTSSAGRYFYWIYWPGVTSSNDFFGPAFLNDAGTAVDIDYGTAPKATFTSDGRAVFVLLGDYGPPNFSTYPTTGPAAQTRSLLYNASGFYFVQTSNTTYDMVSAADGKSWITWEF